MSSITLPFSGYPAYVRGVPTLCQGEADIQVAETLILPTIPVLKPGLIVMAPRPLQRPMRWRFKRVELHGLVITETDDLQRWITGRFWHRIPTMLYAEFLVSRGMKELEGHIEAYRKLADYGVAYRRLEA